MRTGVIAGLLLLVLLLLSCAPRPQTPTEILAGDIAAAKAACVQACAGGAGSAPITLPADAELYATDEAVCAKLGSRLLCGTCPCPVMANVSIMVAGNYTCEFAPGDDAAESVRIACA